MIYGLDLFSGIGGLTIALRDWVEPRAYCENNRFDQSKLLVGMANRSLPVAPIWGDVQTLTAKLLPPIDMVYGGFPCQDISVAGTGEGLDGKRSALFWELFRLVKETKARWIFLENVPAVRTKGLNRIVAAFTDLGYDCRWTRVSAQEVGAPHLRQRWFLLAHSSSPGLQRLEPQESPWETYAVPSNTHIFEDWKTSFYRLPRIDNGLSREVDRIKALGNAVVPIQAKTAFKRLMGLE